MNFAFSEEQEELRRTVRQFLEAKSPETEVRRLMETTEGYDPAVWKQMGQELGLQGLAIPEEYGGQGFTFIELGIVLEEMGRVLLCAPYFSSVGARGERDPQRRHRRARSRRCCPGIAIGRHDRGARVHRAVAASGTRPASRSKRRSRAASYTLSGEKMFVIDGHIADLIVVVARTAGTTRHRRHLVLHGRRRRRRPDPHAAPDDGHDAQAGEARVRQRRGRRRSARRARGWPAFSKTLDQAAVALVERDDGRRAEGARDVGRVREGARAVRPADRVVPGDQAQVRRHAARGRVGQVGRVLRVVGRRRGQRRAAGGGRALEGVLLRGVLPRRPPRTSRSTVASASRGSTPRTCTSSARRAPRSTSVTPRTTASCSPSASASDPRSRTRHLTR